MRAGVPLVLALALAGLCLPASGMEDEEDDDFASELELLARSGLDALKGLNGERKDAAKGLAVLKDAAGKGSGEAAYQVGFYYESDGGGTADLAAAFEFYSQAAAKGHPEGQSALAFMYETGIGAEKDDAKATLYHYFASTGGSISSLMSLGYKHMYGLGVPKSCDTAFSYYNPAAEKVIQEAQEPQGSSRFERVRLSETAEDGKKAGGREDEEIIEYYDYAASKGDTRAQLAMGHLNYWGARGLLQNFETALTWFHQAAEGEDSHAMSMLGHMYANGLAAKQDNVTSLHWFNKAHDLGFAGAGNGLGYMYMHGMGVPQDYAVALEFFVAASEKGNAEAHFNLGAMYIDGIGVDQVRTPARTPPSCFSVCACSQRLGAESAGCVRWCRTTARRCSTLRWRPARATQWHSTTWPSCTTTASAPPVPASSRYSTSRTWWSAGPGSRCCRTPQSPSMTRTMRTPCACTR